MTETKKKDPSITTEDYAENEPFDYTHGNQWLRNVEMFRKCGRILYPPTKRIYEFIKNYCIDFVRNNPQYPKFIWKPKIADVGCGGGFGSNVMSQEADFVWGVDKDEDSIRFAKEVFTRVKNNIYYTPQITFDVIDVLNEPREIQAFDIVACIELIEHVPDYDGLISFLKRLCKKDKQGNYLEPLESTKVFISTPNRNHPKIGKDHPKNKRHIREWTPSELYGILEKNFKYVTLMNSSGELRDLDMVEDVMLFKCETPK
jgi:2-polyprenyl-3-methyl-5-hydroxy-6-metoxy-1,4-benzoquinol methylase